MTACPQVLPGLPDVEGLQKGWSVTTPPASWRLSVFAGRLCEISGSHAAASLTLVFRLVLETQRRDEPAVWVSRRESVFFPPDAAAVGVDLRALAVVWVGDMRLAARAADFLVRSGAFGLVVLDLGARARLPVAAQSRLVGLAKKHDTALVCITEKNNDRASLGSLVSIRAEAVRAQKTDDRFRCEARILKDKRRGPGWTHTEVCHGPDGLR